jgi:glucuronide carrier protein
MSADPDGQAVDREGHTASGPAPLTARNYLAYAGGDAANNLTFSLVSMFLLVYYTDVADIAADAAGTILLVARVWGAVTDVAAGQIVDQTTTRWGRFRPYFVFAGLPLMLLSIAVFTIPGGLGATGTLVYAYASYMLFYLVYSLTNIPFGSLAAAMTQRSDERAKLSGARSIGSAVAIVGLTIVVVPQISRAADLQHSLTVTTTGFAVLGTLLYLFLFRNSREAGREGGKRVSLGKSLAALRRNRPLVLLCTSALAVLAGLFVMQTLQVYYARDVLGNADLTILLTVLTTGAMFVVSPLIPRIVAATGKKKAYVVAGLLTAAGGIGIAVAPPSVLVLPIIAFAVYGVGIAACQSLMWALQADTVDYGEWKTGVRSEGINYSALSFSRKVGQGIGGAVAAWGIGVGGYVAGSPIQSQGARDAIRIVTGLGPAVLVGLGALLMLAYPLTERRYRRIVDELTDRNRERALAREHGAFVQQ